MPENIHSLRTVWAGLILFLLFLVAFFCAGMWFSRSQTAWEVLKKSERAGNGRLITEVVDQDTEEGEVRLVFYYDDSNRVNLALMVWNWFGYDVRYRGTEDDWTVGWDNGFWTNQTTKTKKVVVWGVCEEPVKKVWLDDPINTYANIFYIGDLCLWYALSDLSVFNQDDVVLIS